MQQLKLALLFALLASVASAISVELASPQAGAIIGTGAANLSWSVQGSSGDASCTVYVNGMQFSDIPLSEGAGFVLFGPVESNTTYYWNVACTDAISSNSSPAWAFTSPFISPATKKKAEISKPAQSAAGKKQQSTSGNVGALDAAFDEACAADPTASENLWSAEIPVDTGPWSQPGGSFIAAGPDDSAYVAASVGSPLKMNLERYLLDGTLAWNITWNGSQVYSYATPGAIGVDDSGNAYVAGSESALDAIYLAKFNSSGDLQWVQYNLSLVVPIDQYNNRYDCSMLQAIAIDGPSIYLGADHRDCYSSAILYSQIVKYDENGTPLWTATLDANHSIHSLAVDSSHSVYAAGNNATSYGGSESNSQMFLSKFDSSGAKLWDEVIAGGGWDYLASMAVDNSGNAYLAGDYNDSNDRFFKFYGNGTLAWMKPPALPVQLSTSTFRHPQEMAYNPLTDTFLLGGRWGGFAITSTNLQVISAGPSDDVTTLALGRSGTMFFTHNDYGIPNTVWAAKSCFSSHDVRPLSVSANGQSASRQLQAGVYSTFDAGSVNSTFYYRQLQDAAAQNLTGSQAGAFEWYSCNISSAAKYAQGDEAGFDYALPWSFYFMGSDVKSIHGSSNGFVQLLEDGEVQSDVWGNYPEWTLHGDFWFYGLGDFIFVNNDDLETDDSTDTYVAACDMGDKVVVEWFGSTYEDYNSTANPLRFQLVLFQNGSMEWNFLNQSYSGWSYGSDGLYSGYYSKKMNLDVPVVQFPDNETSYMTASDPITVQLYSNPVNIIAVSSAPIPANQSGNSSATWNASGLPAGQYRIGVLVNSGNTLPEANFFNNRLETQYSLAIPTIGLGVLSPPDAAVFRPGDVQFNFTVSQK